MRLIKKHITLIIILLVIFLISIWIILINQGEYGTTLFFSIPFTISYLIGYTNRYDSPKKKIFTKNLISFLKINLIIITLSALLIIIGLEGAICVLIAYPYLLIPTTLAFILGRSSGKFDSNMNYSIVFALIVLNPTTYIYDHYQNPIESKVTTEMIIDVSLDKVMNKMSTKIEFTEEPNFLFKKGISYPKSIEFNDNARQRYYTCITNNDTINLIITTINSNEVRFKPERNTLPMKELSPYNSIDAKHLHDYFKVNYGALSALKINDSQSRIVATTEFKYNISPKWYWTLWSNYIVDKMHRHVINSIKKSL